MRDTVALEIPQDGRMIYVVTWNQSVLIGTTDTFYGGDKESLPVTAEAVEYLLAGVNRYFPQAGLTAADVLATFVGARPLLGDGKEETEDAVSRDYEIINAGPGRWAITGGKLTTYRAMAERLVDQVVGHEFRARSLPPAQRPAPWSEPSSLFRPTRPAAARDVVAVRMRGTGDRSVDPRGSRAGRTDRPAAPFCWAEVIYAMEHEYVEQIDDLVDRRLGAFLLAPQADLRAKIEAWLRERQQAGLLPQGLAESRP